MCVALFSDFLDPLIYLSLILSIQYCFQVVVHFLYIYIYMKLYSRSPLILFFFLKQSYFSCSMSFFSLYISELSQHFLTHTHTTPRICLGKCDPIDLPGGCDILTTGVLRQKPCFWELSGPGCTTYPNIPVRDG